MRITPSRQGFTLIEVIAAIAISTVLLAAVYVTLGLMLSSVRAGKEAVASLQIVRGTAVRLKTDIRQSLGLLASAPAVEAALAAQQQGQQQNPPQNPPQQQQGSDPQPYQFNLGLQGDDSQLTIYASRLPSYSQADADTPNTIYSDLRTITYSANGDGLVRQEVVNVLSTSDSSTDSSTTTEVLAQEITDIHFQYFDPIAQAWQAQWDGTTNGPPAAIEVTLTIQMPNDKPGVQAPAPFKHRLVIAIPTFGSVAMGLQQ
jgi:prepilin-type N-terminal cleavage/methylation domain-containing protein